MFQKPFPGIFNFRESHPVFHNEVESWYNNGSDIHFPDGVLFNTNYKYMNFNLHAREEISLELRGFVKTDAACEMLPTGLKPLSQNGMTPVCLQLAHIEQMNWNAAPFLKMRFNKALWHIATEYNGNTGWYLAIGEISHPLIRHMGNLFFQYKLRDTNFSFLEKRKSLITHHQPDTGGEMRCHIELGIEKTPEVKLKSFYLKHKNRIHTIDVKEEFPEFCRLSKADIIKDEISREIFGYPVVWDNECYVYRGRSVVWEDISCKPGAF